MTEEGKEKKAILPLPTRDPLLVAFCTLIIDGMLQHGAGEPIAVHCRLPGLFLHGHRDRGSFD